MKNTIAKAIIYRLYSFIILWVASLFFTGSIVFSLSFAFAVELLKFGQYIIFEKLWDSSPKPLGRPGNTIWITGNSGAGKTTLAHRLQRNEIILDGDSMRAVWVGLGFSKEDRNEQNMRVARLAKTLNSQGFDVIVATICPYRVLREEVQKITNCRFIYLEGGRKGEEYPYEK